MNLKKEEYEHIIDLPASDERIIKYLKGETLDVEDVSLPGEKGWYLVCVDGYPLDSGSWHPRRSRTNISRDGGGSHYDRKTGQVPGRYGIWHESQVKKELAKGSVTVNGAPVRKPEIKINTEKDAVSWKGEPAVYARYEYFMLNKAFRGGLCHRGQKGEDRAGPAPFR